jgi:hypothetical protein
MNRWPLIAALLVAVLTLTACQNRVSRGIVAEQKPGYAEGAGSTFTGPANSAAASTQIAHRRMAYYPPPQREPFVYGGRISTTEPQKFPANEAPPQSADATPSTAVPSAVLAPPAPAWIDERTETTFGQHQDAAGLVKAATAIGSWGRARWFGILAIIAAAFGLAWAHNNPDGYPLVCWKIGAVGVFLAVFDPSPWWLLLLLIPATLYTVQKLNITARLP